MTTELLVPTKVAIKLQVSKLETTYKMSAAGLQIKITTTATTSNLTEGAHITKLVSITTSEGN